MKAVLAAVSVGFLAWAIPASIDLMMGGLGFAPDAFVAWIICLLAGSAVLYRLGFGSTNCILVAVSAGLGSTIALIALSVIHAWKTNNPAELGGGFQNTGSALSMLIGVLSLISFSALYLVPVGLGWVRKPRHQQS